MFGLSRRFPLGTAARFFVEDGLATLLSGGVGVATVDAGLKTLRSIRRRGGEVNLELALIPEGEISLPQYARGAASRFDLSPDRLSAAFVRTSDSDPVQLHHIAPENDAGRSAIAVALDPSIRGDRELVGLSIVRAASVLRHYDRTGDWPEAVESDLTLVTTGYAVPLAAIFLREQGGTAGLWAGWSLRRSAAINAQQIGYALALLDHAGIPPRRDELKRLRLDARETYRRSLKPLSRNRVWFDVVQDAVNENAFGEWLASPSATVRMGVLRRLVDDGSTASRHIDSIAGRIGDSDRDVGDQAVLAMRHADAAERSRYRDVIVRQIASPRMDRSFAALSTAHRWSLPMASHVASIHAILRRDDSYSLGLLPVITRHQIDVPVIVQTLCRLVADADAMERGLDARSYFETLESLVDDASAEIRRRVGHAIDPSRWRDDDAGMWASEPLTATDVQIERHRRFML